MEGLQFVVNAEGVRIKKCCASCKFKKCTNDNDHRKCTLNGKKVTNDFLCLDWKIGDFFEHLKVGYIK